MGYPDSKQVGRPREFDEDQVLCAALEVFWEKGFESTSLVDLTKATGLHKGSLYKAFGDKKQLFLMSLQRYIDETFADMVNAAEQHKEPLDSIRAVLEEMTITAAGDSKCAKGCMAVNSIVEHANQDDQIYQLIETSYHKRIEFITALFQRAQQADAIVNTRPAELQAMMTLTFMAGLAAVVKGPIGIDEARMLIDEFISDWT